MRVHFAAPAPLGPRAAAWLDEDDRARVARSPRPHEAATARALVRLALGAACGVAPPALRFGRAEHDRPVVIAPGEASGACFSLTHADDLCAVAVAAAPVGIDAERRDRAVDAARLAARFFAPGEAASLLALPERARAARFLAAWTAKEAYAKARGVPVATVTASCAVDVDRRRLHVAGDTAAWSLAYPEIVRTHVVAVVTAGGAGVVDLVDATDELGA